MKQEMIVAIAAKVAKMEAGQAGQPDYIDWIEMRARQHERDVTEALPILEQAGFVVAPKEPTEEMIRAGARAVADEHGADPDPAIEGDTALAYRAMLSALTEEK